MTLLASLSIPTSLGTSQVHIGHHWLAESKQLSASIASYPQIALIAGEGVPEQHVKECLSLCQQSQPATWLVRVQDTEASKSLQTVEQLAGQLSKHGFTRRGLMIALGGGITTDMVGFAASMYHRGVDLFSIPTTLLAQVDASVGGKTGVNMSQGKNLLGAFYPAKQVWVDTAFTQTQSLADRSAGVAEIVKAALIADSHLLGQLEDLGSQLYANHTAMVQVVQRAIEIKAEIVTEDFQEQGRRKLLNLGHTFAHAFEAMHHYQGPCHGHAVAVGVRAALKLAHRIGLLADPTLLPRIESLHTALQLPLSMTKPGSVSSEDLLGFMRADKKNSDARIAFVLPKASGQVDHSCYASDADVLAVLSEVLTEPKA